jgi:hypothetical protein
MVDFESGTHEVSRGLSVLQVEEACSEVDVALAEAAACLDFLGRLALDDDDSARAVTDARIALVGVSAAIETLRAGCERVRTAPTWRPGRPDRVA